MGNFLFLPSCKTLDHAVSIGYGIVALKRECFIVQVMFTILYNYCIHLHRIVMCLLQFICLQYVIQRLYLHTSSNTMSCEMSACLCFIKSDKV